MGLLFIDGFDHYTSAQELLKYNAASVNYLSSSYARFNGQGILFDMASHYIRKHLDLGTKTTLYIGYAFRYASGGTPNYSSSYPMINFYDEVGVSQVKIHANSNWGFSAYRGDNTLLGSSGNNAFTSYKWYYLEVKVTISDTVGEVTINLNETQILNLTSQDTKNGSAYVDRVFLGPIYNYYNLYVDDFYIADDEFKGDCEVKTFYPDADGNSADFSRSGGSNDFECVDEAQCNEDTDYIYSDTLNHKSIFGITTGAMATIKGIQVNNICRIDQAGTRQITPIIRSNSTDYSGTETDNISADFKVYHEIWETDPDDSNAWTQAKLEAAEFGLEITT